MITALQRLYNIQTLTLQNKFFIIIYTYKTK